MHFFELSGFLDELKALGSPERAVWDKNYHKSRREHWGVPVPSSVRAVRALVKGVSDQQLIPIARSLWNTDLFDPMVAAMKILSLPRVPPSPELWRCVLDGLRVVDGWALEDGLAHSAWKCILADERLLDEVEEWTRHPNFWMRRAALVYTLPYAKPGRCPERMLRWASFYAEDPEWFIQKAIGWWLRVLGSHNPERVNSFLDIHWDLLKYVARKEATRKLPKPYVRT